MSLGNILVLLGVLVLFTPFSGFPQSWLEFILPALGILVCAIGFRIRGHAVSNESPVADENEDSV